MMLAQHSFRESRKSALGVSDRHHPPLDVGETFREIGSICREKTCQQEFRSAGGAGGIGGDHHSERQVEEKLDEEHQTRVLRCRILE